MLNKIVIYSVYITISMPYPSLYILKQHKKLRDFMFSLRQRISRKSVVQVFHNSCSPLYGCARLPHPGTLHDTLWQTNTLAN